MPNLSIRGLDEESARLLKEVARRNGKSVNILALELLRKGLGVPNLGETGKWTDLDHLAGTWTAEEARAMTKRLAAFEAVDEDLWR